MNQISIVTDHEQTIALQHAADTAEAHARENVALRAEIVRIKKELSFAYKTAEHNFAQYQNANDELQRRPAISSVAEAEIAKLRAEVERLEKDAERYRWLRSRDLDTIVEGGVFAGKVPDNVVLNGDDLDAAIDAAIAAQKGSAA